MAKLSHIPLAVVAWTTMGPTMGLVLVLTMGLAQAARAQTDDAPDGRPGEPSPPAATAPAEPPPPPTDKPTSPTAPETTPAADPDDEAGFGAADDAAGFEDPDDAAGFGGGDDGAGFGDDDDAAGFGDSDDGAGFGDSDDAAGFGGGSSSGGPATENPPGTLTARMFFRSRQALWIERLDGRALAKARQNADIDLRYKRTFRMGGDRLELRLVGAAHFEYDLAYRHDREQFDEATIEAYESQIIGGPTFLGLSWGPFELTVGRQIVAWGHGESLSPVDVVNPRDNREPGLADLEDLRMAVLATRLGLFFGNHRLEAMVVHESFFGLRPAPLSEFSPFRAIILEDPDIGGFLGDSTLRQQSVPGRWVNQAAQPMARWEYSGSAADLGLYWASTLDKQGLQCFDATNPECIQITPEDTILKLYHPRYNMVGHAGSTTAGPFVLRWELAAELNRPFNVQDVTKSDFNLDLIRRTQLIGMLGATYQKGDAQVGLEYQQAYVIDNPDDDPDSPFQNFIPPTQPLIAFRYTQPFLREALRVTAAGFLFGVTEFLGLVVRAEFTYELTSGVHFGMGYVHYRPAEDRIGPFYGLDEHDRVFASLRWDFLL